MIRFSTPVPSTGPIPGREDTAHNHNVLLYGIVLNDGHHDFEDFRSGKLPMPNGVREALQGGVSGLQWDGEPITQADGIALAEHASTPTGNTYAAVVHAIFHAYQQAQRNGSDGGTQTPEPEPVDPNTLPPYTSGHDISAKYLAEGVKPYSIFYVALYTLETTYRSTSALIEKATTGSPRDAMGFVIDPLIGRGEGLSITAAMREQFEAARKGLADFFKVLDKQHLAGNDGKISDPADYDLCQGKGDAVNSALHGMRAVLKAAKEFGWDVPAAYATSVRGRRLDTFNHSKINELAWYGIRNLATVCGLYGLRGAMMPDGQRAAAYFVPFMNYDQQDPLRETTTGGGFHVPGASSGSSLSDALSGR